MHTSCTHVLRFYVQNANAWTTYSVVHSHSEEDVQNYINHVVRPLDPREADLLLETVYKVSLLMQRSAYTPWELPVRWNTQGSVPCHRFPAPAAENQSVRRNRPVHEDAAARQPANYLRVPDSSRAADEAFL